MLVVQKLNGQLHTAGAAEPELQNRRECWFQTHTGVPTSSETVGTPAVSLMALTIYYSGPFFQTFQDPVFEAIYQFSSVTQGSLTLCDPIAARQASLSITNSQSMLKLMSIELVMPSNHLILCHPLHLLPSIFPSIRVSSSESVLHIRWPKYWSFSFSISPSNEYSGLISFRIDWLALLTVQGTLKSLLQHHSSKASILQHSDFFMV